MNRLSSRDKVVDQLMGELAERRARAIGRRTGYLALVNSVLREDEPPLPASAAFERQASARRASSRAA